jgi:hypothetical protein
MLALAATLAAVIGANAPAPSPLAPSQVHLLDTPAAVRALCEALTPAERLVVKGDVVQRARIEAAHDVAREAALNGRYRLAIRGERLRFAAYDPDESSLELSERAFLAGAGDALQIWPIDLPGLPVAAPLATAERVMRAAARHTLALVVTFTLPDDDEDVFTCGHASGSNRYSLGVEPFSWEYVDGDQVLARGGEGGDRPLFTVAQGARPRVEVAEPLGERAPETRRAVEARRRDLQGCYERALRANPGLDGSLVAEVDRSAAGAPNVRMAIDSVLDEPMATCVSSVLARVEYPRGDASPTTIPIHFVLDPPAEVPEQGSGGR